MKEVKSFDEFLDIVAFNLSLDRVNGAWVLHSIEPFALAYALQKQVWALEERLQKLENKKSSTKKQSK
jgi:hypothetical protein